MSRQIIPRSYADSSLKDRERFFMQYRPPWGLLVGSGYVQGARPQQYHQDTHDLAAVDGEVAFMHHANLTKEAPPPELFSPVTFYCVSNNAADAGMMLQVTGVGADGEIKSLAFFSAGLTPVNIGEWHHINSMYSLTYPGVNAGDIAVSTNAAGFPVGVNADTVQLIMAPGSNIGRNCTLRSPDNQWYVIEEFDITADRSDGAEITVYRRVNVQFSQLRVKFGEWFLYQQAFQKRFTIPVVIAPGGSISWTVERSASGVGDINATLNALYYIGEAPDDEPKGGDPAGWPMLTVPPQPTEF